MMLLVSTALVLLIAVPCARAGFSATPTFDLTTTSNLAGATDAVYTLHLANPDRSEIVLSSTITIPAGYSIDQKFITSRSGIKVGLAYGHCPEGSRQADVVTTTSPGHLKISFMSMAAASIVVSEPTQTASGTMEFTFTGEYAMMNSGCYADITPSKGFFVNPSAPGTYKWSPSTAQPRSGPVAEMVPRSGLTQTIEIIGPPLTTQIMTSTIESSIVPTTTVLSSTSQTTLLPATTTLVSMTESETTTVQPPATGGAFPIETLAVVAIVLVVLVAVAFYALKRRK